MQQSDLTNFNTLRPRILTEIRTLVEIESPSRVKPALDRLGALLADRLRDLGAKIEIASNPEGGDHVVGRFGGDGRRPALMLGHFDTVWPLGTLEGMPFRVDDSGRAHGPGVYDMKSSLAITLAVLELYLQSARAGRRPVTVLFTSDEEIGSPSSRTLIESLARESAYALVLEPSLADGGLKTARKGVGRFRLDIEGRAAHAGVAPEQGRSAVLELAHQILRLEELQSRPLGTSINVGRIDGGTTSNVVPAHAFADIDVRVASADEQARILAALGSLAPVGRDVRLRLTGGFNRPPMERNATMKSFFAQAQRIGRTIGMELTEGSTGGGSDGNFTAALGVPTLDGLGPRGGGAHAADEHIVIDSLAERSALLLALLRDLEVEE